MQAGPCDPNWLGTAAYRQSASLTVKTASTALLYDPIGAEPLPDRDLCVIPCRLSDHASYHSGNDNK